MPDRLVRLRTDVGRVWRDNHATNVVLHLALRHLSLLDHVCATFNLRRSNLMYATAFSSNVINVFVGVIEILRLTRRMTFYLSAL